MNHRQIKIRAEYLTKKFELLATKNSKSKMKSLIGANKNNQQDFWALRNVSFEIRDGECVGVIGLNGAGKSTLANIISGQMAQTTGNVTVKGDVSIIAANAGMQGNLSGRENIRLKGLMMGMSNREIKEKMDDIIEFSELGPFIDQPVKTYSSGMKAKLGFSIMVHQDPDIMIIDEGLATGDKTFVDKSKKKMFEYREQGKTILLVSHDMRTVKEWCDKVIWLHYGEVKAYGPAEEVIPEYNKFVQWFKKLNQSQQENYKEQWRQEQLDYSIDDLKDEIIETHRIKSRNARGEVERKLKKKGDTHKLSLFSKLILLICIGGFVLVSLVAMSDKSMKYAVLHPRTFLTKHLFKPNAKFSTTLSTSKKAVKKEETNKSSQKHSSTKQSSKSTASSSSLVPSSTTESSSTTDVNQPETPTDSAGVYTVEVGDSLGAIAALYGVTIEDIQAVNQGVDLSVISPGQQINLPANSTAQGPVNDGVIQ